MVKIKKILPYLFFHPDHPNILLFVLFLFSLLPVLLRATVFVQGDLLYWKAHENGLTYAIESKGGPTFVNDSTAKNIDFDPAYGFRLLLGTTLPNSAWDLRLIGTHFHTYVYTQAKAHHDSVLFPTWINAAAVDNGTTIDSAETKWRLHCGVFDLNAGRSFHRKRLHFRPYFGLRYAVARQKYNILYKGGDLFPNSENEIEMKNKFRGIGPLAGAGAQWNFWKGFSLYADGTLALLYSHFYVHQDEDATSGIEERLRFFNRFYIVRALADIALGLKWDYRRFALLLGWEEHLFFGQNQFVRFVDKDTPGAYVSNQGDLSLSGFTGGVQVRF